MRLHRRPPNNAGFDRPLNPACTATNALALIAALAYSLTTAANERIIYAEFGIAAGGKVEIGGNLQIGLAPKELSELIAEQMQFRAEHIDALEKIGEGLGMTNCTATRYMTLIAHTDLPKEQAHQRLVQMGALHKGIIDREKTISDPASEVAKNLRDARDALDAGDLSKARNLILANHGVAGGEDVVIAGDVTINVPGKVVDGILARLRDAGTKHFARLELLSRNLGVTNCATANFLHSLGDKGVPTEQLPAKLEKIAQKHLALVERLQRITSAGPRIKQLRDEAVSAFQNGENARFYQLLDQVFEAGIKNLRETAGVAVYAAEARAETCEGKLTELEYDDAANRCEEAADLVKIHNPLLAAEYLNTASGAYQGAGDLEEAINTLKRASKVLKKLRTPAGERLLIATQTNLGTVRYAQGNYKKARRSYKDALHRLERARGVSEQEANRAREALLNGLAGVQVILNEHVKAKQNYQAAMSILEAQPDNSPAHTVALAAVLTNLGDLNSMLGQHQDAMVLLSRAVDVLSIATPRNELAIAVAKNNLAKLYWNMKELPKAARLWHESHAILTGKLGEEHLFTVSVRFNLASLQRKLGMLAPQGEQRDDLYAQSDAGYDIAYEIASEMLGETHPAVGAILNAIGELRFVQGDSDAAADYFDKAIHIAGITPAGKGKHLTMAGYLNNRAMLNRKRGELEQARKDYEQAHRIYSEKLGKDHPNLAVVGVNLAKIAEMEGRLEDAEQLLREALRVSDASFPASHPVVISRHSSLARLLKHQGKMDASERHYQAAIEATKSAYGIDHSKVAERLFHLCDLYDLAKRPDRSLVCFEEAEAIFSKQLPPEHKNRKAVRIRLDRLTDASAS